MSFQIHCESYAMENENIVSVILRDTGGLQIDESYRFCLVLLQEKKSKRDLIVGCSNITKLQAIQDDDNVRATYSKLYQLTDISKNDSKSNKLHSNLTDISMFEKVSEKSDEITNPINHEAIEREPTEINHKPMAYDGDQTMALFGQINPSFLPGLGISILIISLFLIVWGARKFRNERNNNRTGSTRYSAAIDQISEIHEKENRNRYLKLQATTSL